MELSSQSELYTDGANVQHATENVSEKLAAMLGAYMHAHEASMQGNPLNPSEVAELVDTVAYMLEHDGTVNYAILKPFARDPQLLQQVVDCIGFERLANVPH